MLYVVSEPSRLELNTKSATERVTLFYQAI